jgi:2-oxoglutarate ferredoxin oxidoreductase subunit alpha
MSRINDFSLHIATVNGSGSQSSNNVLMRAIFRMGIPVSGKNLFPSNIQGLPTWFTIRVCEAGWTARRVETEIVICMNDQTYVEDVQKAPSGAIIIHHPHMNVSALRKDVESIPVPFSEIIAKACPDPRLRKLAVNMVYVGVVAELLGVTSEAVELAMTQQFKSKQKVIDLNRAAIEGGREFARGLNRSESFPFKVQPRQLTQGKILIEGNAAAGLGSVFAGCSFVSWYPITPSTSLVDYFSEYAEKYRRDEKTQKRNFAVIQSEDELAAIGMVLGASWMGARAMTATSGPGISLMAEFTGFAYFAEVPAVVFDIQRIGPSTGLPTRTSQGDVLFAAILSHGDTKNICLYPGTVEECFSFAGIAFDLAERFQTPVFVLSDLDLGMNFWMSDPFVYPEQPLDRGKVLTDKDVDRLATFERYGDPDGDGIPYRTLPGMTDRRGVFFTRGSGHNAKAAYTEKGEDYVAVMKRLDKKFQTARTYVPAPILMGSGNERVGIIGYGSSDDALREAQSLLRDGGVNADYLRIRAYPFSRDVRSFIESHDVVFVVDQNRDAQMLSLLRLESDLTSVISKLESILHFDGMPLDAPFVVKAIKDRLQERKAA